MAKQVSGAGWQLCCQSLQVPGEAAVPQVQAMCQPVFRCVVLIPNIAGLDPCGGQMLQQQVQPCGLL